MVTRIMALMASLASRCGLSGSTATAVLASQRENASCSTSFRWRATCIVTAASSSPRYRPGPGQQGPGRPGTHPSKCRRTRATLTPGTADYCARAVTFRSEEVTLQVEDQADGCRFLPDPQERPFSGASASMTPTQPAR